MHKKSVLLAAICGCLFVSACGGGEKNTSAADSTSVASAPASDEPMTRVDGGAIDDTVRLGGVLFTYHIKCAPDKSLPVLVDNQDQKFYQNRVTIHVERDGQEVISQSFTKADFEPYVSASTRTEFDDGLLVGMNLNREASDAHRLCFWAVVGWAGEGPTFRVYLNPGSNQMSIEQDFTLVDNTGGAELPE